MALNQKNLKEMMTRLWTNGDKESYSDLWDAIQTLRNLGLVDEKLFLTMVEKDHDLFKNA